MSKNREAKALHRAIQDENNKKIREILDSSTKEARAISELEVGANGTSLHYAASLGQVDVIKHLLKVGIDINITRTQGGIGSGGTSLMDAVNCAQESAVDFLLKHGAKVNQQDHDGVAPLHIACRVNSVDMVEKLIEFDASVNVKDNRGITPLQISIIRAADGVALYLINDGVDVDVLDKEGKSPLHYAAEWEAIEVTQSLIAKGADVNLQDKDGNTPLHVTNDEDIFDLLVKFGADQTLRNKKGKPAKEERLDMEKEVYRSIDEALSKHGEMMGQRKSHSARLQQQQQPPNRIFSPGPPIPEAELKTARTHMLRELQKKTGFQGSAMGEKSSPSTPRSTALHQVSPLARCDIEDVSPKSKQTSISSSK